MVHFFQVEPLWQAYFAECRVSSRPPEIADGISRVHPRIASALKLYVHVAVETTGASTEILNDLWSLVPASALLVARVTAPWALCLERIETRDSRDQIPVDLETIQKIYA